MISEKSLRKARNRINSVSIRNYFEQKLSEFLKQGLIKTNETNLISTNKRELDQDELVSKQQVDEILNKLFKETSVPAITIFRQNKKRIIRYRFPDNRQNRYILTHFLSFIFQITLRCFSVDPPY